jgi:hypothetical protein
VMAADHSMDGKTACLIASSSHDCDRRNRLEGCVEATRFCSARFDVPD